MQMKFSVLLQRFRCALLLIILFLGLAVIVGCGSGGSAGSPVNTVTTEFGKISGFTDSGAYVYKGIPYAAPPMGDLRWRAPQDPDSWAGVRDATHAANVCTQQIYSRTWVSASPATSASSYTGSEDCLYLDIYRPQTATMGLPVFVWIHGGANHFGGATSYDGKTLAIRGNMIVVVVQYRLAALGWLFHTSFGDEDALDRSGNYGTLDHIKALTWVNHNIAAFGGDPAKVTVGGQSAGGHATIDLIMSPLSTGLFSKAAALSPAMDLSSPSDTLTNAMIDWLLQDDGTVAAGDWSGAATYRGTMSGPAIKLYLRSKTAVKILMACIEGNKRLTTQEIMPNHFPYKDGTVLPTTNWVTTIGTGSYHHVPLLIGNTEYEDKSFMPLFGPTVKTFFNTPSPASPYGWYNLFGVLASPPTTTLATVLPTAQDLDIYDKAGYFSSRMWKAKYTDAVADAMMTVSPSSSIYAYLFQWNGGGALADFAFIYGSGHAIDVPFWFGQYDTDTFGFSFNDTNRPGRVLLMNAMTDYLAAFVNSTTGNPNPAGSILPIWPQWSLGAPNLQTLNANTTSLNVATTSYELTPGGVAAEEGAYLATVPSYAAKLAGVLSIMP